MKLNINTQFSSNNFDERGDDIDTIVIHSTHMPFQESLHRLCDEDSKVSCHYLVDLDGSIYKLVQHEKRAWHAGLSCWRGRDQVNNYSIGIEIVDSTPQGELLNSFSDSQMKSVSALCASIMKSHNIPQRNVVAHSDIAPSRKDDPGEFFNWGFLAEQGVGIYHKTLITNDKRTPLIKEGERSNMVFEIQGLLSSYGYKINRSGVFDSDMVDVVIAFKRRFYPQRVDAIFDQNAYSILQDILAACYSLEAEGQVQYDK